MEELKESTEETCEKTLQEKGMEAAAKFLQAKGFEIIEREFESKFGKADYIAKDTTGELVFVEVTTRKGVDMGLPEEANGGDMRSRWERIAIMYMTDNDDWEDSDNVRFDSISLCVVGEHRAMLRHHRGRFSGSL